MDNGGEYMSQKLQAWMKNMGIEIEPTAPYNPESNGKSERLNLTINDPAQTMLSISHIS